jgi:hypothetical protein
MSTRANIIVYNVWDNIPKKVVILYSHYDWYPTWLWQQLMSALKDCKWDRDIFKCLWKKDGLSFATWLNADIEYLYKVYANGMYHSDHAPWCEITLDPSFSEEPRQNWEISIEKAILLFDKKA